MPNIQNNHEMRVAKREARQAARENKATPQATKAQVSAAKQNVEQARKDIDLYNRDLIEGGFLDIDGDGRTTNYDGNLIDAYADGKRGDDLKQYANPKAPAGSTGLAMGTKIQNLIDTKKLDSNQDGHVNDTELRSMKPLIAASQEGRVNNELADLVASGAADIDGNGQTNETDIKLMNAYFKEGKLGADLVKIAPGADPEQIKTKLLALRNNPGFDSNINNKDKKHSADLNRLTTFIRNQNQQDKVFSILQNNTADVDEDGLVTKKDIDMIETYSKGKVGANFKKMASPYSEASNTKIKTNISNLIKNKTLDTNTNGRLDSSDITALRNATNNRESVRALEQKDNAINWKTVDANNDGTVTQTDFDLIQKGFKGESTGNAAQDSNIKDILKNRELDIDRNGSVDKKDIDAINERFTQAGDEWWHPEAHTSGNQLGAG